MLSHELPEAEVAEILATVTDNPAEASVEVFGLRKIYIQSTKCWTPNPEGIGLNKISRTNGGRNLTTTYLNLQRDKTVKGLLTGKQSFSLAGSERTRHISPSGRRDAIVVTFPVDRDSLIYLTADISPPGTHHEHTYFEPNLPRLCRLAFRIRTISPSGESIFWAQGAKVESL
jgi:hypothetical protein